MAASELTGRVALITGAGRGIGRATALALAQAGADVAVAARSSAELEQTAALVQAQHRRSAAVVCDIGSHQAVRDAIAKAQHLLGTIDILVNNAAVLEPLGPSATIDPQAWAQGLNINLTGAFRCIQAVLGGCWNAAGAGSSTSPPACHPPACPMPAPTRSARPGWTC